MVEECQGGGEGVLEVEAGTGVHGRSEVNQHRSGWELKRVTFQLGNVIIAASQMSSIGAPPPLPNY